MRADSTQGEIDDEIFRDDDIGEDDDDFAEMNCGSYARGRCDLAGTEFCDWSCPLHDEVFPPRKNTYRPTPLFPRGLP